MKQTRHHKEFLKLLDSLSRSRSRHDAFSDFVRMASLTLMKPWVPNADEVEAHYMETAKRWEPQDLTTFAHMLGTVVMALDEEPQDFLGECFMQAEISNDNAGQFFTPYSLCKLCGELTAGDANPDQDLITVQEPAVGAGGMVIGLMEAFRNRGINYQWNTYTVAVDVDERCARMAYIQFSLLGIPAHVVWGDSIRLTQHAAWPTFGYWRIAHKVNRWRRGGFDDEPEPETEPVPEPKTEPVPDIVVPRPTAEQLSLF